MSSRNKRIEALKNRFTDAPVVTSTQSDAKSTVNTRSRHSVYIDKILMSRIDKLCKQIQHEAYPAEVTKSQFLERLLERGLQDIDTIRAELVSQITE